MKEERGGSRPQRGVGLRFGPADLAVRHGSHPPGWGSNAPNSPQNPSPAESGSSTTGRASPSARAGVTSCASGPLPPRQTRASPDPARKSAIIRSLVGGEELPPTLPAPGPRGADELPWVVGEAGGQHPRWSSTSSLRMRSSKVLWRAPPGDPVAGHRPPEEGPPRGGALLRSRGPCSLRSSPPGGRHPVCSDPQLRRLDRDPASAPSAPPDPRP